MVDLVYYQTNLLFLVFHDYINLGSWMIMRKTNNTLTSPCEKSKIVSFAFSIMKNFVALAFSP